MHGLKIVAVTTLVVTSLGLGITGCVVLDSALTVRCTDHLTQSATLQTPNDDTATQFKIDRCKLDSEACNDLCALVLEQQSVVEPLVSCDAHFNGEASVTVNAHYDQATNAPGCSGNSTPPIGVTAPHFLTPVSARM